MSRIKSRDTKAELIVRRLLHRKGYRFRLHKKKLPGSPDIVLPKYKMVIFVHGCFWHRHEECKYAYFPKSRESFWQEKFRQNIKRDQDAEKALLQLGWQVYIIWECETKNVKTLEATLNKIFSKKERATG